ncbi:D-2-hydroxyacid dehydrogenase [Psychrobacter sp. HD31]|uniref:D-2-hydroxyacid dehydrogenase n=1 Tax=Psychrobacter sp. HD31 TaxID=3112003 RepID=UPI003DA35DCD
MKAVFLDRSTFSTEVALPKPDGITDYQVFDSTTQNDAFIIQRCKDADIIITNKVVLNRAILEQLPTLKLIQLTATGMNNVDLSACEQLGITVKNIAGYAVKSVPEHTFMLMLNAMRASRHYHQTVTNFSHSKKSPWIDSNKFCLMDETIYDLEGKTLGIIGMGTIGKRVAEIANVFGMKVLIAERQGNPPRNADYIDFETVLEQADVLTLHCPLTDKTQHLINANTISKMSKKPLIVNVARGGVVDSTAMAQAVKSGTVFGYASDVFEIEPMTADDPLQQIANHPRVFFTPHNAWGSLSAQSKLWDILCKQVIEFIKTT